MKSSEKSKLGPAFKKSSGIPSKDVQPLGSIHQRLTTYKKSTIKPETKQKKLVKTVYK